MMVAILFHGSVLILLRTVAGTVGAPFANLKRKEKHTKVDKNLMTVGTRMVEHGGDLNPAGVEHGRRNRGARAEEREREQMRRGVVVAYPWRREE